MIHHSLDPWEQQYLGAWWKGEPLTDEEAIVAFPDHNWIYDKHDLGTELGYDSAVLFPPSVVKPLTNLRGMGRNMKKVDELMVVQPYRSGLHLSTDVWVERGIAKAWWTMEGLKDEQDSFYLFRSVPTLNNVHEVCAALLDGYTGYFNYETIGGYVIEAHLRPSMQFFDICGGLIEHRSPTIFTPTYSIVYRRKDDVIYTSYPTTQLYAGVTSVQYCFEPGVPLSKYDQDPVSYRYMVINGTDKNAIELQSEVMHSALEELK